MNSQARKASDEGIAAIEEANVAYAREMLARMAFIRAFEAQALALTQTNPPQILGSIHLCAGQEAAPLGAVAGLRDDDQIIATYRGHGWALAAGLDPAEVMAEICHRASGVNGGRGGSAYMMAPHTRFIGENSIVGAGTTIACGVALANLHQNNGRVVAVSIGDGAMNQGAVHEAMAFAAARSLPVIFICENSGWSELTATRDMFRLERLAQRGNAYSIPSATILGTDPIIVRDSVALAAKRCREGQGPVLIECRAPRLWGHYNRDIEHYRPKADKKEAEAQDPIVTLGRRLVASGHMTADEVAETRAREEETAERLARTAMASPLPDPSQATRHVVAEQAKRASSAPRAVEPREMTYIEAVNAALRAELEADAACVVFGEDVGKAGGIFAAARYLQRDFGADRVFDTPIAENAILGSAVGAALAGLKPIVEIMWADFIFVALDQLVNQAANIRYITGGHSSAPLVVRTQQGALPGSCAQHSQSIEAILAHVPGLKVALPATPQDAYSILRAAAADPDPCIVIESRGLYQTRGPVALETTPEPVGKARLHRNGKDAAIIAWGAMLPRALDAADLLEREGVHASVLDLRWLSPLDTDALEAAAQDAGGRVVVVHEAVKTGGFGAEIVARLHEIFGDRLNLSISRVATPDVRMPASPMLQSALVPAAKDIAAAVRNLIAKQ